MAAKTQLRPPEKAALTAKWAVTMTKWRIGFLSGGRVVAGKNVPPTRRWNLVTFLGSNGSESRGIVDLLAIRKDHSVPRDSALKRGDLFEIVLIQVKGGGARLPSDEETMRLRKVADYYNAGEIVLAAWKRGRQPTFRVLRGKHWESLDDPGEVFR